MAIGTDEFDFLDDEGFEDSSDSDEALPAIKIKKTESIDEEDNVAEEEAKQKEIDEAKIEKEAKEDAEFESTIFVVKVTNRKEQNAFELIGERVRKKKLDVYAIAAPHGLTGYLFLEAADRKNAEEAVYNLSYVKQILPTITSYSEIKPMLGCSS
jgi:hypothetical protein